MPSGDENPALPASAAPATPGSDEKHAPVTIKPEELVWLDPAAMQFHWRGGSAPIRLTVKDRSILHVFATYAFPQTDPLRYIQFYEGRADGARGDLFGMLRELTGLGAHERAIVEECLRRGYLVPRVLRVIEVRDIIHLVHWIVETDRGHCEFDMNSTHEQIDRRDNGRVILKDLDGNRYEIPDWRKLDAHSRGILEFYV